MLELEDVQHYLLTRPHATIAQYNFITFHTSEGGRQWVNALADIVGTAKTVMAASESDMRWVSLAFTFNGLRKLGVDETSLATFPEPFRQGMAARAQMLGIPVSIIRIIGKIKLPAKISMLLLFFLQEIMKRENDV
jgi:hypothetical protein